MASPGPDTASRRHRSVTRSRPTAGSAGSSCSTSPRPARAWRSSWSCSPSCERPSCGRCSVATVLCVGLLAWSLRLYRVGTRRRRRAGGLRDVLAAAGRRPAARPVAVRRVRRPDRLPGALRDPLRAAPHPARHLRGTAVAAVVAVLLAVRAIVPVVSGLPTGLIQVVFVFVSVAFLGLGLTVLYAYSGRLSEVVDGLRHANAELHRSELSLEHKVVDRTAELEGSRAETARARDEAVGLSHELAAVLDNLARGAAGQSTRQGRVLNASTGGSRRCWPGRRAACCTSRRPRSSPSWTASGPPARDPRDPAGRRPARPSRGQRHRRPGRGRRPGARSSSCATSPSSGRSTG